MIGLHHGADGHALLARGLAHRGQTLPARQAAVRALLASARGRTLGMDWQALRDEGRA